MSGFNPLKDHAIHETLKGLLSLEGRKELNQTHFGIKAAHVHAINRVFAVAHNAKLVMGKIDPSVVDVNALDDLNSGFSIAHTELNAFVSNGNVGHIDNARNHINGTAAPQLLRLMPIGFEVHPRTEAALESYKAKAQKARQKLDASIKSSNERAAKLEEQLAAQETRINELSGLIEQKNEENEKLISELRQADIERSDSQSKHFKEVVADGEARIGDFLSTSQKHVTDSVEGWSDESKSLIVDLEKKRDNARDLVQSVGDLLTTGTYADRATKETTKADFFRIITVGLFGFGLLIIVSNYVIYAIGAAFGQDTVLAESWQSLVARIATGLAVTLPAFYTARESARHRTNADIAKQRELELTTLGPFIELLPDEQKSAIRDRLTDRYFGSEIEPHDVKASVDIDSLVKVVAEVAKKSNDGGGS